MRKVDISIKLVKVKPINEHITALYELLKNRKYNISNLKIPSFNDHKSFVINNPYRAWYLIEVRDIFVGTVYILKDNCIGIYVKNNNKKVIKIIIEWILVNKKPLPAIKSIRASGFHINLSPDNKILATMLKNMGAIPIQITYSLKNIIN